MEPVGTVNIGINNVKALAEFCAELVRQGIKHTVEENGQYWRVKMTGF